ncbi:hypothetical protein BDW62DRAFT_183964 [Aspergillus aurantiobrunneus]
MEFTLEPALPSDASRITEIYFAAFTNELSQRLMPKAEDVRAFRIANFENDAKEAQRAPLTGSLGDKSGPVTHMIKAVGTAPGQPPVIAGFALWKVFEGDSDDESGSGVEWPASCDSEVCNTFFAKVDSERKGAIGDKRHYYLNMLAVDPQFGRRGLGGKLLKWGLDRADQERVVTFISSSPMGRGLYEKHGCRAVNSYEVVPGYRETSMVRRVAGLSRG